MARIAAGKLDQQITIQRPVEANFDGDVRETWETVYADIWASVEPLSGREFRAAGEPRAELTHTVQIRYRTGLDSRCRITWGGKTLQLIAPPIDVDAAGVVLEMACREVE